ncbi:hypothetical protein RMCBS344292_18086 [Rhizopus microsporus]|nr:hypothetical protein RMCBS344292_18086 [Rhizopus microsporus]
MNLFKFNNNNNTKSSAASTKSSVTATTVDLGPMTQEPILTPPTDYQPVLNDPLDEEQKKKVHALMEYVESIMLPKEHEYFPNEKGFLTEATANRYLRARKWDLEAAKTMLENSIKWRREFRPDQLDPEIIRPEAETGKMYYNGYDKTGKPLWIMKPRNENSKDSDRQIKHVVFNLERGIRLMPPQVEKVSIVVDFKGSSITSNPSASTCKKFIDILANHYPERLGVAFFVNSPWFFLTTFKMVAPFMDPVTRNKIKFIDEDTNKNSQDVICMEDCISPEQIEASLGGKFNFNFDIDTYWDALLKRTDKEVIEYL